MNDINVLYEDKYLICIVKPIGILSEDNGCDSMPQLIINRHIKDTGTNIYTVHRLDKAVSGVMVYAKDKRTASVLSNIITNNEFTKKYLAVVSGSPEDKGEMKDILFKNSAENKSYVIKNMRKGAKEASLEYKTLMRTKTEDGQEANLVEILLHTGRSHQIRVQFASRKMPLFGDGKYGSREKNCSVALFSREISFVHPYTNEKLTLIAEMPAGYPWNMFDFPG